MPPHLTSWRSILILYSHLCLCLTIGPFPLGLSTKTVHVKCFNIKSFYGEELLAPCPSWKINPCWLSTSAYSIYSELCSIYGVRLSFPSLRTRHAVVTGTHLSWTKYWACVKLKENSCGFLISITFHLKCLWHQVDKSFFSWTVSSFVQFTLAISISWAISVVLWGNRFYLKFVNIS